MKKLVINLLVDIFRPFVDLYKIVVYLLKKITKKTWRVINVCFFLALIVAFMTYVYFEWSKFGPYTFLSFFSSLIFHGLPGLVGLYYVDSLILKYYESKEQLR